jgi:hypothetical protein
VTHQQCISIGNVIWSRQAGNGSMKFHHDLTSEIISKEFIFQTSLTIRNITAIRTPLVSCNLMLSPWPPLWAMHSFRALAADYTAAPTNSNMAQPGQWICDCWGYYALCCLGPYWGTAWMYMTMVHGPHLDLHIGTARWVHSIIISEFSIGVHKLDVMPKLRNSTMERSLLMTQEFPKSTGH